MKKSYIVRNVMKAVNRYLAYGWDVENISSIKCEDESNNPYIKSLTGDIFYFHFSDCERLYPDFIIRFGSRKGGDILYDIDILRVERDREGKVTHYKYMFVVRIKDLCLAEIIADTLSAIYYTIK